MAPGKQNKKQNKKQNNLNKLVGVSIKSQHHADIDAGLELPPLFEIISENYMKTEGFPLYLVTKTAERCPFSMHGVSLSPGSESLDRQDYLRQLKKLADTLNPLVISDHLCWTGWGDLNTHDLLPLPLNQQSLQVVCDTISLVQDYLGRRFTIENISRYIDFHCSDYEEIDFLSELINKTGCSLLLDVNNVFVNSVNFGFDPYDFIRQIPAGDVAEYHIAGHTDRGSYLYDTHVGPVPDVVMDLFAYTIQVIGQRPTILEWDSDVPSYPDLLRERERIERLANDASENSAGYTGSNSKRRDRGYYPGERNPEIP